VRKILDITRSSFPGCFYRLGVRNEEKGIVHNVHTPLFDIDEKAIRIGMGVMAWLGASAKL
jgi:metal-dependent amidase/aminoacylase/carboxypeptidase family protein